MSNVKEIIAQIEAAKDSETAEDTRKVAVTARLTEEEVWRMDYIAKHLSLSRSGLATTLLTEATIDAAEQLGYSFDDLRCIYISEKSGKSIEEVKEMWSKSGIFVQTEDGQKVNVTSLLASKGGK